MNVECRRRKGLRTDRHKRGLNRSKQLDKKLRVVSIVAALAWTSSAIASPPPPPPEFVNEMASQLVKTQTAATFGGYASLLADDLAVSVNGKASAKDKAAWLAIERNRLGKVDRFVYGYVAGRDDLLVLDRFDDKTDEHCPSAGRCIFDPRSVVRAVRYEIGRDHLVHAIRIVQSDGLLVPANRLKESK